MSSYKIVYENNGKIVLDEECTSLADALDYQRHKSPFRNTMVLEDDGTLNLDRLSTEEAHRRVITPQHLH